MHTLTIVLLLAATAYCLRRAAIEYTAQRRAEAKDNHPSRGQR